MLKENRFIEKLNKLLEKSEKLSSKLSFIRLLIFLVGTTVTLLTFFFIGENATYFPLFLFLICFLIATHFHSKIISKIEHFSIYLKIKKEIFARKILDWQNITNFYEPKEKSNLDRDLNISGSRSLLHLINLSANNAVAEKLYRKLTSKKNIDEIKINQRVITELSRQSNIINRVLLYGYNYSSTNFNEFKEWLFQSAKISVYPKIILIAAYLLNIILLALFLSGVAEPWFYYSILVYIFCYYIYSSKTAIIIKNSEAIVKETKSFSAVFNYLCDVKPTNCDELNERLKIFTANKTSLKSIFKTLKNIISFLELRGNPFVWFPIILIFPVDVVLVDKLTKLREKLKDVYPQSVEAYNDLAADIALAVFKLNNDAYCTPVISEDKNNLIETVETGHPLIQFDQKITNTYNINCKNGIDIITGSNMSGKSTFLRTVGVNLLLAYSGTSVNAERFVCSNLNLFTCINVSDSVVDGISYFYSEVKRLNELLKLKEKSEEKIFILIDEIFKGTNNKERLEGSRLFIENIIDQNIFGLISTHDLELAKLDEKYSQIRNYHFRDSVKNNNMIFDYKIQEGVCPTTNALKIIRSTMNI